MNKLTIEHAENIFKEHGFVLMEKVYKSVNIKMSVKCPKGHDCEIRITDFRAGTRCTTCSKKKKKTIEELVVIFQKEGYTLLSKRYKNATTTKLKTLCPLGHVYKVTWANFQTGKRCSICYGNKKKTLSEIKKVFKKEGFKVIDNVYLNAHSDLVVLCSKGHKNEINYDDFCSGKRCLVCKDTRASLGEKELFKVLKKLFPSIIKKNFSLKISDRPYIHWFESDIFYPKKKLGIEFDGTYSHSFEGLKRGRKHWPDEAIHNYHGIKDEALLTYHGITLLHIKEEDWKNNKQDCINKCIDFLGSP